MRDREADEVAAVAANWKKFARDGDIVAGANETTLGLTHFVHPVDHVSRVYLDHDDGLELQPVQLAELAPYGLRVFVQRLILPLPQPPQRLPRVGQPRGRA